MEILGFSDSVILRIRSIHALNALQESILHFNMWYHSHIGFEYFSILQSATNHVLSRKSIYSAK